LTGDLSFSGRANIWLAHNKDGQAAWFYSWRIKRLNEYCANVTHRGNCTRTYTTT
jgi:hypothetical protein